MSNSVLKDHPAASLMPMLDGDDLNKLAADILEHGLIEPGVVFDGMLLDGRNRRKACEIACVEFRTRTLKECPSPTAYVLSVNEKRRHLTPTQRAVVAREALPMFREEAKARQVAAGEKHGRGQKGPPQSRGNLSGDTTSDLWAADQERKQQQKSNEATRQAAAALNVSHGNVEALDSIAKKTPDVYDAVKRGEVATVADAKRLSRLDEEQRGKVFAKLNDAGDVKAAIAEVKRDEKRELAEQLDAQPVPQTEGTFDVIVIDPPWRYEKRAADGSHRGRNQYPDMSTDDIFELPVAARANTDCVLWLWTTNAFMHEAYHCLEYWGFTPKTILTWAKNKMGVGDWLRGQTEHAILAVRGKPLVTLTNQTTLLTAPVRQHSRKPDEFYALVESLCHGAKLDMFAREARDGWVLWGAETGKFGELDEYS